MNTAIETRNLVKRYGKVTAVDGLSLRVEQGEIYILGVRRLAIAIKTVEISEHMCYNSCCDVLWHTNSNN